MTTNGTPHPIPAKPAATPAERPTFRRLVVEVVETDTGGREWVLETVEPKVEDVLDYMREGGHHFEFTRALDVEQIRACHHHYEPAERVCLFCRVRESDGGPEVHGVICPDCSCEWPGQSAVPEHECPPEALRKVREAMAKETVVGATPSGEAVRMGEPPVFVQGMPGHMDPPCDKPIANRPEGWRCALPAGHEPVSLCDGKKESPVRMVGAERAEVEEPRTDHTFGPAPCAACGPNGAMASVTGRPAELTACAMPWNRAGYEAAGIPGPYAQRARVGADGHPVGLSCGVKCPKCGTEWDGATLLPEHECPPKRAEVGKLPSAAIEEIATLRLAKRYPSPVGGFLNVEPTVEDVIAWLDERERMGRGT